MVEDDNDNDIEREWRMRLFLSKEFGFDSQSEIWDHTSLTLNTHAPIIRGAAGLPTSSCGVATLICSTYDTLP